LLKTFNTGLGGWADRQLPAGTLFFPALATSTGQLVIPESSGPASVGAG
jgi:hypothetical protein